MKLIGYLSNGYPSLDASKKMAEEYVNAGIDIIEIDFPSSNPYLENDLIATRMAKALEKNSNYQDYMNQMIEIRQKLPNTDFILLAYENTVEEIGIGAFIDFCLKNDFLDLILVGLKDEKIKTQLIASGIKVSCYVQYHMDEKEIKSALDSNGFVYMQAKPTSNQVHPKFDTLRSCIEHLRALGIQRKIYCGVGIHTESDVAMARDAGADAVFIGSSILKLHENIPAMKELIARFKACC